MTETSTPYQVEPSIYPPNEREKVLNSQEFYWTAAFTNALLMNGDSYENYDELIDEAIALKEALIKKIS